MNATKNLAHLAVLALWAVAGAWFSMRCLFGTDVHPGMLAALSYWLWFGGLTAVTSFGVSRLASATGALTLHAAAFLGMSLLPRVLPLSLLRLGLDLLAGS
jgi:hypothetical protein